MASLGILHFWAFLAAGILLNLTPGVDTMYILGRSISCGMKAGILSALGISTGSILHTLAAATGLSLVLAASATAFHVVKYFGAAYLVYLGVQMLFTSRSIVSRKNGRQVVNYKRIYLSGILTNVLNPKVALFFLAFLPQFIDPAYPTPFFSFLVLGALFITTGTIWCLLLAVFAAKISALFKENKSTSKLLNRLSGLLFIGLGVKLAVMKR